MGICFLLVAIFFNHRGVYEQRLIEKEIVTAKRILMLEKMDSQRLFRRIHALKDNRDIQEYVVREYLGFTRKGDDPIYYSP